MSGLDVVNLEKKNKRRPVYDRLRTIKNMKRGFET